MPPYPQRWPGEDTCAGEESPRPGSPKATDEFDLRDCLLQDGSPPTPAAGTDPRDGPKEAPFSPEGLEAGDLSHPMRYSPRSESRGRPKSGCRRLAITEASQARKRSVKDGA